MSGERELGAGGGSEPILRVLGLEKRFRGSSPFGGFGRARNSVHALRGVDLELWPGRTLAVVGVSGSGKTTLGRALLRLVEPDAGQVFYRRADGSEVELRSLGRRALRRLRPELQIVFQDPTASLNPRFCVREIVGEAPRAHGLARGAALEERIVRALARVGLERDVLTRFPHAFSAGQRQRIALARALVLEPRVLVCDEPTSALDVSVQAQVLNLLIEVQEESGIAYLFIAHDLSVVRALAHEVLVMHAGRVVERGETARIFAAPAHAETVRLVDAVLPVG